MEARGPKKKLLSPTGGEGTEKESPLPLEGGEDEGEGVQWDGLSCPWARRRLMWYCEHIHGVYTERGECAQCKLRETI